MIIRPRIIPIILIEKQKLIKTVRFKNPKYLGDPINAVKIFNEKAVDELCIIDKSAKKSNLAIDYELLQSITSEAFMPLSYGGGIESIEEVRKLIKIGFEKVIFNSALYYNPDLIKEASIITGSQSIVASIDYKKNIFNKVYTYVNNGKKCTKITPVDMAIIAEKYGAGEILLTSIDKEGKMSGYDIEIIKSVTEAVNIPVIASGGAGQLTDFTKVIHYAKADAAAASSFFVYFGLNKAVLINFPEEREFLESKVFING